MPLFVLRIADDGAAKADGRLSVGDQIIEINGVTTHLMTHAQVGNGSPRAARVLDIATVLDFFDFFEFFE